MKVGSLFISIFLLSIISITINSCGKESDIYDLKNELFLDIKGTESVILNVDKELTIDLIFTKGLIKNSNLTFKIVSPSGKEGKLTFINNPITINKNIRKGEIKVKYIHQDVLTKAEEYIIDLEKSTNSKIRLHVPIKIIIKPASTSSDS